MQTRTRPPLARLIAYIPAPMRARLDRMSRKRQVSIAFVVRDLLAIALATQDAGPR